MSGKKKAEVFISPTGRAIWPNVNAPDKKFKKEYGEYRTRIRLDENEAQPLVDKIEAALTEEIARAKQEWAENPKGGKAGKSFASSPSKGKVADKPYQVGEGDEAGTVTFNFKTPAGGKRPDGTEWTRQLAVFDAKKAPLPKTARVGSGSTIKVAYSLNPFTTAIGSGVSLRLEAVQVLELKEFERDAASFGFESEEGFEGVTPVEAASATDDDTETVTASAGADF